MWPNASRAAWNRFRPSTNAAVRLVGGSPPIDRPGKNNPARGLSACRAGSKYTETHYTVQGSRQTPVMACWGCASLGGGTATHVPPIPVLLVDDIVGSRWTITLAAWLLRLNGSGRIWPVALSSLGRS